MKLAQLRLVFVFVAALVIDAGAQEQWGRFRGPNGQGVAAEVGSLPTRFGPEKALLWKCPVSVGHSSPCIWGDRIFLTGAKGQSLEVLCIRRVTGKVLWRRELPARKNSFGTGASLIVVGKRLVFCRDTNEESYLEVIDPKTGKTIWKKDRSGFQSSWSTPSQRRAGPVLRVPRDG